MARRIREENVTKSILVWLEHRSWEIVCFDFPQSGTGRVLHTNDRIGIKNKDTRIPDIIAVKNQVVVFFENKDRFYLPDFIKIDNIKVNNNYSKALQELLSKYKYQHIYYGIGLPITDANRHKVAENTNRVDFVIDSDGTKVVVNFQRNKIF